MVLIELTLMATIKVPESICLAIVPSLAEDPSNADALKQLRTAIKSMIENAITDGLTPAKLPQVTEAGITMSVTFAAKEDRTVRQLARTEGIREGDASLKFLYAAIARGDLTAFRKSTDNFLAPYLRALGKKPMHHQGVFGDYLKETLASTSIGMIEGATGIGKTLAIIGACIESLQKKTFGRCLVAVPTLQLLSQFAGQHAELNASFGKDTIPPPRVIVGRSEFVCVAELQALLGAGTEMADPLPIRTWLSAGGPPLGAGQHFDSCYLLSSLRAVSPAFPAEAVRLNMDSPLDDPGAQAYAAQFVRAEQEASTREVIYCTHAMLAADIRRRLQAIRQTEDGQVAMSTSRAKIEAINAGVMAADGVYSPGQRNEIALALSSEIMALSELASSMDVGLLPPWQSLIIDEAHVFESNLANTLASTISLGSLLRHLGTLADEGLVKKSALASAKKALVRLKQFDRRDEFDLSEATDDAKEIIAALQEILAAIPLGKRGANHPLLPVVRLQAQVISAGLRAARDSRGSRALLCYSPVRTFPQLNVGRQNVRRELAFLWQSASSAACVSATLYLRRLDRDSAAYSASVLNIPQGRLKEFPIVRPGWTHEPVKELWIPEPMPLGDRFWLRPPSRRDQLAGVALERAISTWYDEVATAVQEIHATAAGGVLVLLGSYDAAQQISIRLSDQIEHRVVASNRHSTSEQLHQFVTYRLAGHKAIWFAVGAAWTGVDINGANYGLVEPSEDNLLTDLIIPRLPFGLNRSMTHRTRLDRNDGVSWELFETAMRFKQGLGRLVRRFGLPKNRRIYVLDGRCNDPVFENYFALLRRIMAAYPIRTLRAPHTHI